MHHEVVVAALDKHGTTPLIILKAELCIIKGEDLEVSQWQFGWTFRCPFFTVSQCR